MTIAPSAAPRTARNSLLRRLGSDDWARISPSLELVPIRVRQIVHDIDQPIEHVYFVEEGMVSIVAATLDGTAVEVGTVGREGMAGVAVALGSSSASVQAFGQVEGKAYRMSAAALRDAMATSDRLRMLLANYTLAFLTQCMQGSACNRLHSMRQRCARWLLETHDRVDSDSFALTHEFLAQMLGVRRATVTEVAGQLQRDGMIQYEYRRITIADRKKLEATACECYAIVQREYRRLIDGEDCESLFARKRTAESGETALHEPEPGSQPAPIVDGS